MGFAPEEVAVDQYPIIQKPDFGGEANVFLSTDSAIEYGKFEIMAADSGVFTADPVNDLPSDGKDLVAVIDNASGLIDEAAVTVTANVTFADNTTGTAVATFEPPGYARVEQNVFPVGFAVDLVPSSAKKIKAITSVSVDATLLAKGAVIAIWGPPDLDGFALVGCTTDKDFSTKARPSRPIACGMDGSAFSKRGRSEPGELNITAKVLNFGDGLARFNGVRCTAMVELEKEDTLISARIFFAEYVPTVRATYGDGEDEATFAGTGIYEDLIILNAPTA